MKTPSRSKTQVTFQFVLEELIPIRPTVKPMFGFGYVFVGERLVLLLRDRVNQPWFNGIWLATTEEHFESLEREFPLSPSWLVKFAKKHWLLIPLNADDFEEYSLKACDLILRGDVRIGRLSTPKRPGAQKKKESAASGEDRISLFIRGGRKTKDQE